MRKTLRKLMIICILTLAAICLSACTASAAKQTYKITYNANGGKNTPKKTTKKSSKKKLALKITKKKPTRSGYAFKCWNTKKNGSGKNYKPGTKVTLKKKKATLKLYAVWKKNVEKQATRQSVSAAKPSVQNEEKAEKKDEDAQQQAKPSQSTDTGGKLEVHFLDVGQGDCTLIMCDGEYMLVDAGDNTKGTAVQSYLQSKGVTSLKYAIGTHPDADHIGGLDVVITKFNIDTLFMPPVAKDTKTYNDVIQAASYKNLKITAPKSGATYSLGKSKFQIVSTDNDYGTAANDWSICIRLVNGNNSFLLIGDAEEAAELDMLKTGLTLKSDVYKAAHHGSKTGSIQEFMNVVKPAYAVISCGVENDYGHPHAAVLNTFRTMGVSVFRTDEQGTIVATSDGTNITWNTSPSDSWKAGEPKGSLQTETPSQNSEAKTFVLNTNSGVFHLPSCNSVSNMSEKNKEEITCTHDEMISKGYKACGNCNP